MLYTDVKEKRFSGGAERKQTNKKQLIIPWVSVNIICLAADETLSLINCYPQLSRSWDACDFFFIN